MSILRKRLILTLVVPLFLIGGQFLYTFIKVWSELPESYAAWTAGNGIVDYLLENSNQWPRNWNELRTATNRSNWYIPADKLKGMVKIDWHVNLRQLSGAAKQDRNLRVQIVTRLDGMPLKTRWGPDTEPNAKILRYLRRQTNPIP